MAVAYTGGLAESATPYQPEAADPLLEPWRWRTFPELTGLGIHCVAEASDDTLWFGTAETYWTYDGFAWSERKPDIWDAVGANTLCAGRAGMIYAGGRWGIKTYSGGRWSHAFPSDGRRIVEVNQLLLARDDTLWAASSLGALIHRDGRWILATDAATADKVSSTPFHPAIELVRLPEAFDSRARLQSRSTAADHINLRCVAEDADGRIWMGSATGEILCWTPHAAGVPPDSLGGSWTLHTEADGIAIGTRPSILARRDGSIWVVYGSGSTRASIYERQAWRTIDLTAAGVPGECAHPLETGDGTVWLSSRYAVHAWRHGAWRTYRRPEVPIPTAHNLLLQSRDGALWIAGPGTEMHRIDYETSRWITLRDLQFRWESPSGTRWYLHRSGRVVMQDGQSWTSHGPEDGVIDTPVTLLGTRTGDVWVAGSHGGTAATARFDGTAWTMEVHRHLSWGIEPRGVFESSDGSLWFTAAVDSSGPPEHRAGILQYTQGVWIHHHQPGRAPPGRDDSDPATLLPATQRPEPIGKFITIGESSDGSIWTGRNFLVRRIADTWSTAQLPDDLRIGVIEAMFTSSARDLWIGTRQFGALRFDGDAWQSHHGPDSLMANSVRSFAETGDGTIWAATDRGVSRYDGRGWTADLLPAALQIEHDGGNLVGTTSGTLWINRSDPHWSRRGWSKASPVDTATCLFQTTGHLPVGTPPRTTIVSGSREVAYPGNLSVLWSGVAPWRSPDDARLQYSFRLDDGPWSPFAAITGHAFFSLSPGRHRLEVRARDRDFNVDPTPAVLEFVVLPPVWRQAWFLALVTVLIGAAGTLSARVILERRNLRRTNLALADEIAVRRRTEDALRVGEATLTEAQRLAHLGSWTMDLARNHLLWSDEVYRIFEVDPARFQASYDSFLQAVHPEDRERVDLTCRGFAQDRRPFDIEHRIQTPDGRVKFVNLRCRAIQAPDEQSLHVLGTVQDITDRKLAEQRIWKVNRTYAVLSDINALIVRARESAEILAGSCRIAVDTGGFAFAWLGQVEPTTGRLCPSAHAGGSPQVLALVSDALASDLPPAVSVVCNDLAGLPASPLRDTALAAGHHSTVSLPLIIAGRPAGALVLYSNEPGFFDDDELRLLEELAGDIAFALEGCRREEERRRALVELSTSEERFRELAETIEDVFWITDPAKARVIYASPAYDQVWGRSREELYARPRSWLEAVHPDDRDRIVHAVDTRQAQGAYDEEYRIVRPDGSTRWIRDRAFPVRGASGSIERILGVARDITESRELEARLRQSQKLEAIGQLAGGVAHDFNNILAAIMMQIELAELAGNLPAEVAQELQDIRAAALRAVTLTRQLLVFSRRQAMHARDVDLNETVKHLARMLQRIIGEDVHLEFSPHASPLITHADPGMLDQVLLNLVVNARDAMPDGGRVLVTTGERMLDDDSARVIPEAQPGRYVWLSVSDTGSGIPPDVLPRIYEPFFTTKEPGRGTGLGLATVFSIVKQHRGWISIETEVNRGTCFQVFLPATENLIMVPQPSVTIGRVAGGTETLLLVEDDPAVRTTTRTFLRRHGYDVIEAASGLRALAAWEAHRDTIRLVITDIVMPDHMTGQELAVRLREDRPGLRIIFTSGYSASFAGREITIGDDETFLQKPYPPEALLAAIRTCLDDTRPTGAAAG